MQFKIQIKTIIQLKWSSISIGMLKQFKYYSLIFFALIEVRYNIYNNK